MMRGGPLEIGRYALYAEIAHGGMATVHLGRLCGAAGFTRTVAIKRLHPQFARDPEFVAMFMDEARLAGRIRHPHVVSVIDVVALEGELLLVMDFVHGVSLSELLRAGCAAGRKVEPRIAVKILCDALSGLHAAHETRDERGEPLGVVHRDVSPPNILIAIDGNAQLIDFGVAKAAGRFQSTREGQLKGKLAYMAPEQILGHEVDRLADVYAAGVVLWETLAGHRLYQGQEEAAVVYQILEAQHPTLRSLAPDVPDALDDAVNKAIAREPAKRFSSALAMAEALEAALAPAAKRDVAKWVASVATSLERQAALVTEVEGSDSLHIHLAGSLPSTAPRSNEDDSGVEIGAFLGANTTRSIEGHDRRHHGRASRRLAAAAALVLVTGGVVWAFGRTRVDRTPGAASPGPDGGQASGSVSVAASPSTTDRVASARFPSASTASSTPDAGRSVVPSTTRRSSSHPPGTQGKDYGFEPTPNRSPGKRGKDYGFDPAPDESVDSSSLPSKRQGKDRGF